jgi:1,4-alpha-glucan branching enzyme
MDFVWGLHSHLPYVLNHGRWPHGSDWITEAAIDTYLPLLETLRALRARGVPTPVTIGFTPILANQLAHPTFTAELEAYFTQRLEHCAEAPESLAGTADAHLLPLVGYWRDRLLRLRDLFRSLDTGILGAFRELEAEGRLEIMSSAATHGFLPLLGRDESIYLQLFLGHAEHVRLFGREPSGCWVPECGYRPRGVWKPLPEAPETGIRPGIEEYLADAGYRYFFVDSHMARAGDPLGLYGEAVAGEPGVGHVTSRTTRRKVVHTPYQVYRVYFGRDRTDDGPVDVFVRDPRSSAQVWSRHGGYPGDAPYLEFHKIRWPGGLKLWRVSAAGTDIGSKEPYDPPVAEERVRYHGSHFADLLGTVATLNGNEPGAVVVAPFDTELFGHWWFEGVDFLGAVFTSLHERNGRVVPVTASTHLDRLRPVSGLRLARGTWGRDGDYSMWLNPGTRWTWPRIWALEESFWNLAPTAVGTREAHPALEQAARALLLLQSSDWQFIISTGEVADYAIRRFTGHAEDVERLLGGVQRAFVGEGTFSEANQIAAELRVRDDVFPEILPSISRAIAAAGRGSAARRFTRRPARGA